MINNNNILEVTNLLKTNCKFFLLSTFGENLITK